MVLFLISTKLPSFTPEPILLPGLTWLKGPILTFSSILDLFEIFPYGIGRIPVRPESTIPGLNYLYAIGFSYLFAIIMSIINPKRTILWLFAIPPVALIYRILKKITKYYKK